MGDREQLHELVDRLPDGELVSAVRYLEFLNAREAPVDPEMLARIDEARANRAPGIPHEDVLKEFGL